MELVLSESIDQTTTGRVQKASSMSKAPNSTVLRKPNVEDAVSISLASALVVALARLPPAP